MTTTQTAEKIEINGKHPSRLIAVYGTLRKGFGNWSWALKNKSEYLGQYTSESGYKMYTNGGFPIVVLDNDGGTIEYEVYKVTDNEVLNDIHRLEGCTGIPGNPRNWYDIKSIETPHGKAYIYVHHTNPSLPVIPSGDWKDNSRMF